MQRRAVILFAVAGVVAVAVLAHSQIRSPSDVLPTNPREQTPVGLAVQYADACAQLAEVELDIVLAANKKAPKAISASRIEWLKANVAFSREQQEIARQLPYGSTVPVQIAYAEARVKHSDAVLQAALEARNRNPDAVDDLTIKKLRLKVEVDQLRLQMWASPSLIPTFMEQMQWQIDRLTEEVVELNHRIHDL